MTTGLATRRETGQCPPWRPAARATGCREGQRDAIGCNSRELTAGPLVRVDEARLLPIPHCGREGPIVCLLRSLPGSLAEIPERFSSSSLPPSFAQGRCVAFLYGAGALSTTVPLFHGASLRAPGGFGNFSGTSYRRAEAGAVSAGLPSGCPAGTCRSCPPARCRGTSRGPCARASGRGWRGGSSPAPTAPPPWLPPAPAPSRR